MKSELITHADPKSPVSEVFRTLRTNIQFMDSNKELKSLLVTSTMPAEGKTWIASNLAITFAQAGKRVILIDADMRKPRLHNVFEVLPKPGLSNYLSGFCDESDIDRNNIINYLRETEISNLFVMTAGNVPPNPSELLVKPQMEELLKRLKQQCDLIIFDGTPSKLVTDAVILSRIVDLTVVVTSHNQTKKDDLAETLKNIENVGGKLAGVIYNRAPITSKKYKETYYYAFSDERFMRDSKEEHKLENDLKNDIKTELYNDNISNNQDIYKEENDLKSDIKTESDNNNISNNQDIYKEENDLKSDIKTELDNNNISNNQDNFNEKNVKKFNVFAEKMRFISKTDEENSTDDLPQD